MRHHRRRGLAAVAGNAAALLFGIVVAVGAAELAARIVMPNWSEYDSERWTRSIVVPGIGQTNIGVPGYDGWFAQNDGDFRVRLHINALGLRNPDGASPDGALWMVGDSFTFGWGVERDQAFGAVAARDLGLPSYSVASPGTDVRGYRALLARMPATARPKAVLLGLCMENDIEDYQAPAAPPPAAAPAPSPSVKALFAGRLIAAKEWLIAHSGFYNLMATTLKRSALAVKILTRLGLIEPPLAQGWEIPRHSDVEIASTAREVDAFRHMLPPGTPFAVVMVPSRFDIEAPRSDWGKDREALVAAMRGLGVTVADPEPELVAAGLKAVHFAHDGHWTVLGHRIAGDTAARVLAQAFPQLQVHR